MRGIIVVVLLGICEAAFSQTPVTPAQAFPQNYATIALTDLDGVCDWYGFEYDKKTKMCNMRITFSVRAKVACTPPALNSSGEYAMTCSYKVKAKKKESK